MADKRKYCGAKTRKGGTCKRPAGWGTSHVGYKTCKLHGGSMPTHVKSAQNEQALEAVQKYALPIKTDPHEALIDELERTAGWIAFLNEQVQALDSESDMLRLKGGGKDGIPEVVPDTWIQMLNNERAHFVHVAKTCIAVGIEERRVKIAEQQGELIAGLVRGLLEDLNIPITDEVRKVVRNRLTLIQGGKAA